MINSLKSFFHTEMASGIVLMAVAGLAMLAANSPVSPYYETFLAPSAKFFINDGLMAVFFLLVGLEIRAEMNGGSLATLKQAALPLVAALGGVITPALIYMAFNNGGDGLRGWAIPSATDIAFSLGVLALFGSRLPESLKICLMAIAVIDDVAAIIIIALFYSGAISAPALLAAALCVAALWLLGKRGCARLWPYLLIGAALWYFVHASGVHATVAGVALGLLIPPALGETLIARLHGWVAFFIVPLFAFANAGVAFSDIPHGAFTQPITLGIALGLLLGKPIGITIASLCYTRYTHTALPAGVTWNMFFAMSMAAGIGFTMSLFIGDLAFENPALMMYTKLGVMLGSLASAIASGLLLWRAGRIK